MGIMQGLTNKQRAMKYYGLAAEFTDAYRKLSKADGEVSLVAVAKDLMQASVKLLLLGHALELVMKGWLVLYEDNPVTLSASEKKRMKQAGQPVPETLKDYSHNLEKLADAVVQYYPGLQPYLEKTMPVVDDETGAPVLDEQGQQRKKSILEHLNSSYWGDGERQYEYPEAKKNMAFLSPLDSFADFVDRSRHALLDAIKQKNGGVLPLS